MKNALGLFVLMALLVGQTGCRMARPAPPSGNPQVDSNAVAATPHLKPGLIVRVEVFVGGKKELEEPEKRVSSDGEIILPLIGRIRVDQRTLDEVSRDIEARYAEYLVKPQVIVEFALGVSAQGASPWGYITVLGRVRNSGRIPLPPTRDLTVSGAIQAAGGLDTSANDTSIRVTRQLPNGDSDVHKINLRSIGEHGRPGEDLMLQSGDVVFVPETVF